MKEIPPLNQPERMQGLEEDAWSGLAQEALEKSLKKLEGEKSYTVEKSDGKLTIRDKNGKVVIFEDTEKLLKMYEEELKLESRIKENLDEHPQPIEAYPSTINKHEGLVSRHEIGTMIDPLDALLLNKPREDQNKKGH